MIKSKIKSLYHTFTKSEKKVATYILENDINFNKITSYDLAKATNVSQPTIIRFSQKIGFSSFNCMVRGLVSSRYENNQIKYEDPINIVNSKIVAQYTSIVNITTEMNSDEEIQKAINLLLSSQIRIVFGVGTSALMCNLFCRKLNKIGLYTMPINGTHMQQAMISTLSPKDVVIFISQSGETTETVQAAKITKQLNIPSICITKFGKSKLSSLCDVFLKTAGVNDNTDLCATTLKISQLNVLDMLYLNLIKANRNKNIINNKNAQV